MEEAAVRDLSFHVDEGEVLALVGESGSGKTTLLRMIAGLERPTSGEIEIGGRLVQGPKKSLPPEKRGVGLVFQEYALFPHLTVVENIAYGRRIRDRRATRAGDKEEPPTREERSRPRLSRLCPLPTPHRRREYRLRPQDQRPEKEGGKGMGGPRTRRPDRPCPEVPARTLRRAAAEGSTRTSPRPRTYDRATR